MRVYVQSVVEANSTPATVTRRTGPISDDAWPRYLLYIGRDGMAREYRSI